MVNLLSFFFCNSGIKRTCHIDDLLFLLFFNSAKSINNNNNNNIIIIIIIIIILTDRQLILVYCSITRSVLEYASPAWADLTQYLSDQIESMQKRALKLIFPSLYYEDALTKSGLILLRQRREDACITFLKSLFFRPATKLSAASCRRNCFCACLFKN